jgi:hypothetical protein
MYGGRYERITYSMFAFVPPGILDAGKYVWRRVMRLLYPELRLSELILMSVTREVTLSVSRNSISPLSLEVTNHAPCEITAQPTARMLSDDGVEIALTTVEEPWQIIGRGKSKPFSVRPNGILESGRQKVAEIGSKSMTYPDYMNAVLSVKVAVRTNIYDEIQISRSLALRIKMTN